MVYYNHFNKVLVRHIEEDQSYLLIQIHNDLNFQSSIVIL